MDAFIVNSYQFTYLDNAQFTLPMLTRGPMVKNDFLYF